MGAGFVVVVVVFSPCFNGRSTFSWFAVLELMENSRKRMRVDLTERVALTDAFYRYSDVVSAIPTHVKWYIVSLLEGPRVAPSVIAELDVSFGRNRWGRVYLASI